MIETIQNLWANDESFRSCMVYNAVLVGSALAFAGVVFFLNWLQDR